jgi:hypothetical protein
MSSRGNQRPNVWKFSIRLLADTGWDMKESCRRGRTSSRARSSRGIPV